MATSDVVLRLEFVKEWQRQQGAHHAIDLDVEKED